METQLRAALIDWLRNDPALADLNGVEEESPLSVSPPWLGISASASTDWSTKDRRGRETRVAFELQSRGDDTAIDGELAKQIDRRIESFDPSMQGLELASGRFLKARAERRPNNLRAVLLEYRFRYFEI